MIALLESTVQGYAWGSTTAIPDLLGVEPDGKPKAELWIGAHPKAPSRVGDRSLDALVAGAPAEVLGARVAERFGQLPFLMKVLAAKEPLSIQCHPDKAQAEAGFARENAARIPLDAPERNYRDANHKPELICALSRFRALKGFRELPEIVEHFEQLELQSMGPFPNERIEAFFERLMLLPATDEKRIVDQAAAAAAKVDGYAFSTLLELYERYPGDIGVLAPLFLNCVTLEPGQALFLKARELHSYLEGVGIEIMASSDNVLRGGLTPKHVDVQELLRTLTFEPAPPEILDPAPVEGERTYAAPVSEFLLSSISVAGAFTPETRTGIEILLATEGTVRVNDLPLPKGQACVVTGDEPYVLYGAGQVFRARVP